MSKPEDAFPSALFREEPELAVTDAILDSPIQPKPRPFRAIREPASPVATGAAGARPTPDDARLIAYRFWTHGNSRH